jgi:phosphohistidine phosphatase
MKKLYLLRHAQAEEARDPKLDIDRNLNLAGRRQAEALRAFLHLGRIAPDLTLVSPALRTQETARGALDEATGRRLTAPKLYLATAETLVQAILEADDAAQSLMIVAHNPGIAELAYDLSRGDILKHTHDFTPGTLVGFTLDSESWRGLTPVRMALDKVFSP